jgi:hypothetical protein
LTEAIETAPSFLLSGITGLKPGVNETDYFGCEMSAPTRPDFALYVICPD